MAKALKQHKAVGEDYLATVKPKLRASHAFPFPASAVWAALLDADAWTEWLPITKVIWTSPEPFGVGTTRTVEIGDQRVEEVFFAWEDGMRMAFYFDKSTLPVSAAIEDYRVVATDSGCELHWAGKASAALVLGGLVSGQLAKGIREGLPKLEALIRDNPSRFGL
ncbi:SRPBCC family protein [Hyphomonas atlantica]|uniref:SRPBCC family protein n=1 Tax=Hyphomonas atlantica TaxID=1280948 RepID=A0A059E945_9PROT|nr:SRPBCC family protein [Hyphomonas atlantica]KCZ64409.1 hypothetical protein HY36_13745 [Hyphomonas atlantica]